MENMEIIVMYCMVPNKKEGKNIARFLVEEKLAAAVSIFDKAESIFAWRGEIVEEKEALLMIKTRKELFCEVKDVIQKLHSYEVAEIIALPVLAADEKYLGWLMTETKGE